MEEKKKSGLAIASLILSIVGVCTSFIPIINNLSFVLGVLGIVLGIIAIVKKSGKGMAIAAIIISILAIVFTISAQNSLSNSLNNAINDFSNSMDELTGNKTEDILKNNLDVTIGKFTVTKDKYGIQDTEMKVTLKNKCDTSKSFDVQVEAIDKDGNRIDYETIYANNLGAGQSQTFKIFTFIPDETVKQLKNATFRIIEASMY